MTIHTMSVQNRTITAVSPVPPEQKGPTEKTRQASTEGKKTDKASEARKSPSRPVLPDSTIELHEELRKLLGHLHAQTMIISGEGVENFCNHNDQIKSDYLWAICDTAERALKLLDDAC